MYCKCITGPESELIAPVFLESCHNVVLHPFLFPLALPLTPSHPSTSLQASSRRASSCSSRCATWLGRSSNGSAQRGMPRRSKGCSSQTGARGREGSRATSSVVTAAESLRHGSTGRSERGNASPMRHPRSTPRASHAMRGGRWTDSAQFRSRSLWMCASGSGIDNIQI